jgi:lauroyl/myristoyl acyltransferase
MELVLGPAADWLPLDEALRRARTMSRLLVSTTYEGRNMRREMERAFACASEEAAELTAGWFERQLRDFVFLRRVAAGLPLPSLEHVTQTGSTAALELVSQPGRLIVATGHFAREAAIALYSARWTPGAVHTVWAPVEAPRYRPYPLRMGLQFATLLAAVRALRGDAGRLIHVEEKGAAFRTLARLLAQGQEKVNISVDSYWHKGRSSTYERPFAGEARKAVSVGPARLARVTQTPVVICVPYVGARGEIVLEWSGPFAPPAPDAHDQDRALTDLLLGVLEGAVGERPTQYVLSVGGDRRWHPARRRWHPMSSASPAELRAGSA